MDRRTLLKCAPVALGVIALPRIAQAQTETLRLHQFLSPQATIPAKILRPWADRLAAASGGALTIEHFDAMALGGRPNDLFDQARDGVVDISATLTGYTPGRFPVSEVFELPFMTTNPVATSKAFYEMVEAELQASEYSDVKVLGAWVHGPGLLHTAEPVTRLEDLTSMTLRAPSRMVNDLLAELGAAPVGMPLPAVPEALSRGVIGGALVPWEVTPSIRLSELVRNHTDFVGDEALYTATIILVMNKARYEALPAELRAVLDAESGMALSQFAAEAMWAGDASGRAIAVAAGNNVVTLDAAETARWKAAAQPVYARFVADMNGRGTDGQALIDRARALIAKHAG
jgi:TRAP-type C4-dicarboxylate transport system substrate-binding protein